MKLSALFIALIPLLGSPVIHAETTAAPVLENRAAQGDITTPGGARRLTGDQTEALRASLINKPAKNVILLIGDGMGDSEITAARNYAEGAGGFFKGIDALPLTGQYTHYSLDKKTGKPDYVTDSAASATAWTTGVKTYNGALGVDIHENAHQTILELAKAAGLATGNVSTAELQDATPAALVAHVTSRKCYGPTVTSEKLPQQCAGKRGQRLHYRTAAERPTGCHPGRRREDLCRNGDGGRVAGQNPARAGASARLPDCDRRGFSCRRDGSQSG